MSEKPVPSNLLHRFIATTFFTGYLPLAPGTAGTTACLLIFWFLPEFHFLILTLFAVSIFVIGLKSANALVPDWGKDPGKINIDEVAGMLVALIGLPKTTVVWLTAFLLFRLFDIVKPPPIRRLEYLPAGWGIMMDDIAAGIYTNICCVLIFRILI